MYPNTEPSIHTPNEFSQKSAHSPRIEEAADRSAVPHAMVGLVLAVVALVSSPILLVPALGFVPAVAAAIGAIVAWLGVRRSNRNTWVAVTALVICVILFGLTASVATAWTFFVVNPAVGDYEQLHEVLEYVKEITFGG